MAKAPYKLPNVFVGCPYGGRFKFSTFKSALDRIPFKWFYADTSLATKQLLGILRSYITAADFCIFDISLWNPNVALEIGVADGLGAEYYILLDRRLSKGVPADIQGIQRIEYASVKGMNKGDLVPSIVHYLVKEHTHPRNGTGSTILPSACWHTFVITNVSPVTTYGGSHAVRISARKHRIRCSMCLRRSAFLGTANPPKGQHCGRTCTKRTSAQSSARPTTAERTAGSHSLAAAQRS